MTERPVIFSGPMVNALLAGRKTQTRRLASSPLAKAIPGDKLWVRESCQAEELTDGARAGVAYIADEAWRPIGATPEAAEAWGVLALYRGRGTGNCGNVVPSIHMPRWASRLTLAVAEVRRQPLHAITDDDAEAEGMARHADGGWWCPGVQHPNRDFPHLSRATPREMFAALWDVLHGAGEWLRNPEVVALTFKVERADG